MTINSQNFKQRILSHVSQNTAFFLESMREMWTKRDIPNISWNTAAFLIDKLRIRNICNVMEIGPANGFSTLMLSLACPEAEIHSIEFSRHAFEELRHNIQTFFSIQNSKINIQNEWNFSPADFPPKVTSDVHQEKIGNFSLYYGDAREIIPAFLKGATELNCSHPMSRIEHVPQRKFDCIFIDGAFRMTREFFDLSLPLLAPGGIIILDDAIKYRWKMEGFHEYLEERNIDYELVQTDEDDGVMLINGIK